MGRYRAGVTNESEALVLIDTVIGISADLKTDTLHLWVGGQCATRLTESDSSLSITDTRRTRSFE